MKTRSSQLRVLAERLIRVTIVVFFAYIIASTLAAMALGFLTPDLKGSKGRNSNVERPDVQKMVNFRDVRKTVVARNVFNSDGEVPEESDPSENQDSETGVFDKNAQCSKSSLPLELMGTIYAGELGDSLATVREKGYSEADVYRVGDNIVGNEQAQVYAIEQQRLVLNNNGKKECIELKAPGVGRSTPSFNTPVASNDEPDDAMDAPDAGGGDSSSVQLESAYVEEALGPGFAKILDSGRLVPFHKDNAMVGFKLIGAKANSLWRKAGLKSGDVITTVNGTSMAEPDKGFAIFEALQNEKEIRVEYLKSGKSPSNISIEIR